MKIEVLRYEADPFIEDLREGSCHLVSIGAVGLTHFSAYCDVSCDIKQHEQEKYVRSVNRKQKTSTLYPKANITILLHPKDAGPGYTLNKIKVNLRDALTTERDQIKSKFIVFDFRCCRITGQEEYIYNHCIKELLEEEFADLEGTAFIYWHTPS